MKRDILLIAISVGLAASLSTLATRSKISQLEAELVNRPPVIVVDQTRIAMESLTGNFSEADIEEHARKFDRALQALRSSGALIIRSDAVLFSPEGVTVTASDLGLRGPDVAASGEE